MGFILAALLSSALFHFAAYGSTLAYETYGSGPSVWVLLAGGPGYEPRYLKTVVPFVKAPGRTIVLFHQRGTGASRAAVHNVSRLNVQGEIDDLDRLRVALHQTKLHLIGHSWGGYLAMAYAAQYPDRTAAMILLDALADDPRSWLPITDAMVARLPKSEQVKANSACTSMRPSEACDEVELPSFFYDRANMDRFLKAIGPGTVDRVDVNDPVTFDIVRRPHLNALRSRAVPALVVYGAADPYGAKGLEETRTLLPGARFVSFSRSGHFTWIEEPAEFGREVNAFMDAHL